MGVPARLPVQLGRQPTPSCEQAPPAYHAWRSVAGDSHSPAIRQDGAVTEPPELRGVRRQYAVARRLDTLVRRRSLSDDALVVVLEYGPARRLPESWRLQQRQPKVSEQCREAALAEAHEVTASAYELTERAWPSDRSDVWSEVDRVAKIALEALVAMYPDLDRRSLSRAVNQANYTHAK